MARVVSRLRAFLVCIVTAGLIVAPAPGFAQPAAKQGDADRVARAEAAFKKGVVAFDAGALDKALAHYRESYALWPRARTLLNLGLVSRKLGRTAEAANFFAQYLEDDAVDEARVPAVQKALAELDSELGRLRITSGGSGEIMLDGQVLAEALLSRPLRVAPGAHRLSQGGVEIEVEVRVNEEAAVTAGKVAAPAAPEPPPPPPPAPAVQMRLPERGEAPAPRRWYLWAAVPTVLAGGSALVFGLRHRSQQSELDDILAHPDQHDYADAVAARDRAQSSALYTNLSLGVFGVGAVATATLFLLRPKASSRTTVALTADGASFGWAATW